MIKLEGMPANKLCGKIWDSDKQLIIKWRQERLISESLNNCQMIINFNSSEERLQFAKTYSLPDRCVDADQIIAIIKVKQPNKHKGK